MLGHVPPDARGMSSKGGPEYRARRRERRTDLERAAVRRDPPVVEPSAQPTTSGRARRAAATTCAWCHGPITLRPRGPIPRWCSATCRHRAWEQTRAVRSGRSAVKVVERVVVTPAPPVQPRAPRHDEWAGVLRDLAGQIDHGLVYDRELLAVAHAVDEVIAALRRRPYRR